MMRTSASSRPPAPIRRDDVRLPTFPVRVRVREVVSKNTQAQGEMDEGVGENPSSSFSPYIGLVRSLSHDNRTIGFPNPDVLLSFLIYGRQRP